MMLRPEFFERFRKRFFTLNCFYYMFHWCFKYIVFHSCFITVVLWRIVRYYVFAIVHLSRAKGPSSPLPGFCEPGPPISFGNLVSLGLWVLG